MGTIKNRADIKSYLGQIGEITREGKDYISVKPNGFKKAIRLKGAIFEKKFDIGRIGRKDRGDESEKFGGIQKGRTEELEKLEQRVKRIIEKRAQYNFKRYSRSEGSDADDQGRSDADENKISIDDNYGGTRRSNLLFDGKKRGLNDGIGRIAYATIERIRISREKSAKSGERKGRAIGSIDVQNSATKQPDYRGFEQYWEQRKREQRRRRFAKSFELSFREFERQLNQLIGKIDQTIEELENRLKELEKQKAIPKIKPEIKPAPGPKKNFSGPKL